MSNVALIVECLRAYRDHVRRPREAASVGLLKVMSFEEIVAEVSPIDRITELLHDPIRSSLRGRVREEGWRAFVIGGIEEMKRVSDAVEDAMSEAPSFAGSTLDKWWDGVGSVKSELGWCS